MGTPNSLVSGVRCVVDVPWLTRSPLVGVVMVGALAAPVYSGLSSFAGALPPPWAEGGLAAARLGFHAAAPGFPLLPGTLDPRWDTLGSHLWHSLQAHSDYDSAPLNLKTGNGHDRAHSTEDDGQTSPNGLTGTDSSRSQSRTDTTDTESLPLAGMSETAQQALRSGRYLATHPRSYVCQQCGKAYTSQTHLSRHKVLHRGLEFPCPVCGKRFSLPCYVRQHLKCTHQLIKRYQCTHCGIRYSTNQSLQRHLQRRHSN